METPQTPPNARQVTQDADWWGAALAARAIRWQTSIEDFRRLVAMTEETAASAREATRAAETARHRVISTCYLGEYAVAHVVEAHLRCLSSSAELATQHAQDTALAAQQAYDMVRAACARQIQPYTPAPDPYAHTTEMETQSCAKRTAPSAPDPYARTTEMETQVVRKAYRAVAAADRAVQVAHRAVQDAERNALSVRAAVRGAEYAARLAAIAADYARQAARVMQSRYETETR